MSFGGRATGLTTTSRERHGEGGAGEIFRRRGRGQRDLAWEGPRGRGARDLEAAWSMSSPALTAAYPL